MKFISFAAGVACTTLLAVVGSAQTTSGSITAQSQVGQRKAAVTTKQDTNIEAQTKTSKTKTQAQTQSRTKADTENSKLKLANGTQLRAVLKNTLESKQVREGQTFLLQTTNDVKTEGQIVIKKGSSLIGHVVATQSKAEGKGQSELTLMVDGLQQGNQIIPLQALFIGIIEHTGMQALNSDPGAPMPALSVPPQNSGGLLGGATGVVNGAVGATGQAVGNVEGGVLGASGNVLNSSSAALPSASSMTNGGMLNESGQALFSLPNGLTATSSGSISGATEFTRAGKEVKLEKGTEFLLAIKGNSANSATMNRP